MKWPIIFDDPRLLFVELRDPAQFQRFEVAFDDSKLREGFSAQRTTQLHQVEEFFYRQAG